MGLARGWDEMTLSVLFDAKKTILDPPRAASLLPFVICPEFTGTWLFALPAFEKWWRTSVSKDPFDDDIDRIRNSYIWLSGDLGAGKTMLM